MYCPSGVTTLTRAVRCPGPVGLKVTPTLHVARGLSTLRSQLLLAIAKSAGLAPSTWIDDTDVGTKEMFSTSNRNSGLTCPMTTVPRSLPPGFARNAGSPPVPRTVELTLTAPKPASATVRVADTGPGASGVKLRRTVQSAPGGTGAPSTHVPSFRLMTNRRLETSTVDGRERGRAVVDDRHEVLIAGEADQGRPDVGLGDRKSRWGRDGHHLSSRHPTGNELRPRERVECDGAPRVAELRTRVRSNRRADTIGGHRNPSQRSAGGIGHQQITIVGFTAARGLHELEVGRLGDEGNELPLGAERRLRRRSCAGHDRVRTLDAADHRHGGAADFVVDPVRVDVTVEAEHLRGASTTARRQHRRHQADISHS